MEQEIEVAEVPWPQMGYVEELAAPNEDEDSSRKTSAVVRAEAVLFVPNPPCLLALRSWVAYHLRSKPKLD